LLILAEC